MSDEPLYCTHCGYEMGDGHALDCAQNDENAHRGPLCEVDGVNHRERGEWCRYDHNDDGDHTGLVEFA